jgi:multidrug resistance efflux pump
MKTLKAIAILLAAIFTILMLLHLVRQDDTPFPDKSKPEVLKIHFGTEQKFVADNSLSGESRVTTSVAPKFAGWIEKLYVTGEGVEVRRGDPLFEIYSPELYRAETDYVVALQNQSDERQNASLVKLRNLGLSEDEILVLGTQKAPKWIHIIRAPCDGVVLKKKVETGQMVTAGECVYEIQTAK